MIRLTEPVFGLPEQDAIRECFAEKWLSPGPKVRLFEQEWAKQVGVADACAVSSGTMALAIALRLMADRYGGKHVVIPSFTCAPTLAAVVRAGLWPILVDAEPISLGMSPSNLWKALDDHDDVVAVVPVHVYGAPCNIEVFEIAADFGVRVLEDACEAHGATYPISNQQVGSVGYAAAFSFRGDKMITTMGTGGAIVSDDEEFVHDCRQARDLYLPADRLTRYASGQDAGWGAQLSEPAGAFGREQIKRLSTVIMQRRDQVTRYGRLGVSGVLPWQGNVNWRFPVRVPDPMAVIEAGMTHGVEMMPVFTPLHEQQLAMGFRAYVNGVSRDAVERLVCLPMHPGLSMRDLEAVVECMSIERVAQ